MNHYTELSDPLKPVSEKFGDGEMILSTNVQHAWTAEEGSLPYISCHALGF